VEPQAKPGPFFATGDDNPGIAVLDRGYEVALVSFSLRDRSCVKRLRVAPFDQLRTGCAPDEGGAFGTVQLRHLIDLSLIRPTLNCLTAVSTFSRWRRRATADAIRYPAMGRKSHQALSPSVFIFETTFTAIL